MPQLASLSELVWVRALKIVVQLSCCRGGGDGGYTAIDNRRGGAVRFPSEAAFTVQCVGLGCDVGFLRGIHGSSMYPASSPGFATPMGSTALGCASGVAATASTPACPLTTIAALPGAATSSWRSVPPFPVKPLAVSVSATAPPAQRTTAGTVSLTWRLSCWVLQLSTGEYSARGCRDRRCRSGARSSPGTFWSQHLTNSTHIAKSDRRNTAVDRCLLLRSWSDSADRGVQLAVCYLVEFLPPNAVEKLDRGKNNRHDTHFALCFGPAQAV